MEIGPQKRDARRLDASHEASPEGRPVSCSRSFHRSRARGLPMRRSRGQVLGEVVVSDSRGGLGGRASCVPLPRNRVVSWLLSAPCLPRRRWSGGRRACPHLPSQEVPIRTARSDCRRATARATTAADVNSQSLPSCTSTWLLLLLLLLLVQALVRLLLTRWTTHWRGSAPRAPPIFHHLPPAGQL